MLVNTNLGPGPLNTNWGSGPVNTNYGPGPGSGAKQRAGDRETQTPVFMTVRASHLIKKPKTMKKTMKLLQDT